MYSPALNLAHFDKKVRGKIRLSIYMGRLLHFIYLAVRTYKNQYGQLAKYCSFRHLIKDYRFIKSVLQRAGKTSGSANRSYKYFMEIINLVQGKYTGLLDIADVVWDLTVTHKKIKPADLFKNMVGLQNPLDTVLLGKKVKYMSKPFIIEINEYRFIVIETELGDRSKDLAKTLVYVGSPDTTDKSLGLFARLSMKSIDAEKIKVNQDNGYMHILNKKFRIYPTLLRMQRLAYRKVRHVNALENEVLNMLSELYIDANAINALISMDVPANVMLMAPSISLSGGLCFATVFRGELLDVVGADKKARIKVDDVKIYGYPAYYSVLPHQNYPGDYVFVVFHPFTAPRIGLITATYPVDVLDKFKPKKRSTAFIDKIFPKVKDVAKRTIYP